jgi:hypothetical protein
MPQLRFIAAIALASAIAVDGVAAEPPATKLKVDVSARRVKTSAWKPGGKAGPPVWHQKVRVARDFTTTIAITDTEASGISWVRMTADYTRLNATGQNPITLTVADGAEPARGDAGCLQDVPELDRRELPCSVLSATREIASGETHTYKLSVRNAAARPIDVEVEILVDPKPN